MPSKLWFWLFHWADFELITQILAFIKIIKELMIISLIIEEYDCWFSVLPWRGNANIDISDYYKLLNQLIKVLDGSVNIEIFNEALVDVVSYYQVFYYSSCSVVEFNVSEIMGKTIRSWYIGFDFAD